MRKSFIFVLAVLYPALMACAQPEPATEEPSEESASAASQGDARRGTAQAEIAGNAISVDYGRPTLQGRDMLARLPDGEVWRLGMDAATSLSTEADLAFGDVKLPAGSYTMFARKESADVWKLLINSQTGIWGTQYNAESDVAEVPLEKSDLENSVERFTIQVNATGDNSGEFVFQWATLQLTASFSVE